MTAVSFAYWLQGLFELSDIKTLDEKQVTTIKNHLNMVFKHDIDPSMSADPKVQQELSNLHNGNNVFNQRPNLGEGLPDGSLIRC